MTTSITMATRLKYAARKLKKAAKWHGSGLPVDIKTDDYVYELLCYFHVALAAQKNYSIRLECGIKKPMEPPEARWPKKPGMKENFSYLKILDGETNSVLFQLCPGINVTDKHGKDRAPDINLLSGAAPTQPTHNHLLASWDAKHTSGSKARLPDTAVSDFIFTYQQLGQPTLPAQWCDNLEGTAFVRSGLFTNGNMSTERDAALSEAGVSETCNFPVSPMTRP